MASKIGSTVAATLASVTGFLNHYGNELGNIVTVLETAMGALPVPPATANNVRSILDELKASVVAVTEAANSLSGVEAGGGEVVVNEADIDAAVNRIAGPLIAAAVAEALAKANARNGNA